MSASTRTAIANELAARLRAAQQADGGWAYYPRRASRIEATCWGALALSGSTALRPLAEVERARAFLASLGVNAGPLREPSIPVVNYAWNGLALIFDRALAGTAPWTQGVLDAIVAERGLKVEQSANLRQLNQLQAWPWIDGTFSWIEPTAYCLLALKTRRTSAYDGRIAEAEALVVNRVCDPGGWNYGNAQAFTQDLRPYVPTSALVLLAMQDRRDEPAVAKSVDWLGAHALGESSALALGLAALALHIYGRPVDTLQEQLLTQDRETGFLENSHLMAVALYALTLDRHDGRAFRL